MREEVYDSEEFLLTKCEQDLQQQFSMRWQGFIAVDSGRNLSDNSADWKKAGEIAFVLHMLRQVLVHHKDLSRESEVTKVNVDGNEVGEMLFIEIRT